MDKPQEQQPDSPNPRATTGHNQPPSDFGTLDMPDILIKDDFGSVADEPVKCIDLGVLPGPE